MSTLLIELSVEDTFRLVPSPPPAGVQPVAAAAGGAGVGPGGRRGAQGAQPTRPRRHTGDPAHRGAGQHRKR